MALPVAKLLKIRARDTGQPNNLGAVLVNINDTSGWFLQRGLSFGGRELKQESLTAAGFDGEFITATSKANRILQVPLKMTPQTTFDAMMTKWDALVGAIDNKYFIVEFQPMYLAGATPPTIYWFDCYRSPAPSMWGGEDEPPPDHPKWLRTGITRVFQIQAAPAVRKSTGGTTHL